MKLTSLFFAFLLLFGIQGVNAQDSLEVTHAEKEVVALELERESQNAEHSPETKSFLKKISRIFKGSKDVQEVEVNTKNEDCVNCKQEKRKNFFKRIGQKIGKGAAWLTTTTAKPFMTASAFVKGALEKGEKNKELLALYQFFLNHQEDFDGLYLQAGTPEDMVELMLLKMEEIMEKKSRLIMKDFLLNFGINKEIPEDMSQFELTAEEIASIDEDKIDVALINNHPEYKEVKGLIGEMTKEELMDIVSSGYFDKSISFEDHKKTLPSIPELVGTVVGQIFAPKIAFGIVSKTLAGLYALPVLAADIGTGVSAAICLKKENQEKFDSDKELKMFCSYVTNRSAYELMKGRSKGYVAGKKFHQKIADKVKRIKQKRIERRKKREEQRLKKLNPELA